MFTYMSSYMVIPKASRQPVFLLLSEASLVCPRGKSLFLPNAESAIQLSAVPSVCEWEPRLKPLGINISVPSLPLPFSN